MKRYVLASLISLALSSCWNFTDDQRVCQTSGDCLTAAPPALIATHPEHDAADVPVTTDLTLLFSKSMRTGSVVLTMSPPVALKPGVFEEDGQSGTFEPLAALAFSQLYTVSVSGKDIDGNDMSPASFSFTTQVAPDTVAPTLVSTVPTNGLNNVATTAKLILTFSEAMDPSSLQLTSSPDFDWGVAAWSMDSRSVTMTPSMPLSGETMYVVAVAARDLTQNALLGTNSVAFTTAKPPDMVPPEVVATAPLADAMLVSPNAAPSVSFSEPMDPMVMASTYFTINPAVPCNFAFDPSTTTLTCNHPSQPNLASNTLYTVTIGVGAKDKSGLPMAVPFSFSFTTGMMPDTTAPTVSSTNPANAGTGAPVCTHIAATFSESMDKAATQSAFSISNPPGITGTFSWSSNTMTFNPTTDLNAGATISWQVSGGMNGARDLANNPMAGTASHTFQVAKNAGPTNLYAHNGHSGYVRRTTSGGALYVSTSSSYLYAGDIGNTYTYRSLLEFDLASIPATAAITSASLYVYQYGTTNTPYGAGGLGSLILDRLDYGASLAGTAYAQADIAVSGYCPPCSKFICQRFFGATVLSTTSSAGWKSTGIRDELAAALAARKLQLRLRFGTKDSDSDTTSDYASFTSAANTNTTCTGQPTENPSNQCKPFMRVSYTYP
jgi:hypothetical protein